MAATVDEGLNEDRTPWSSPWCTTSNGNNAVSDSDNCEDFDNPAATTTQLPILT